MKSLAILIVLGMLYGYTTLKAKSLLEDAPRMRICDFNLARFACDVLAEHARVK